jgi:acetolactate synthase-1/2/3 large subunit
MASHMASSRVADCRPSFVSVPNLMQGGLASMGCGLPSAIGAAMANPSSTCLAVAGDGGFAMTSQVCKVCMLARDEVSVRHTKGFNQGLSSGLKLVCRYIGLCLFACSGHARFTSGVG